MYFTVAAFVFFYVAFVFPWAYFRHDDWLIIGNAVRLEEDWAALWRPTLVLDGANEEIWFFRPFFKLATYVCFRLFAYWYPAWLSVTLALTVGAIWFSVKALNRLTGSKERGLWFTLLFCTLVPLHFGSLFWVGEGLMNCPQLFLLGLNLWLFCEGTLARNRKAWHGAVFQTLGVVAFGLSLGFKETGAFHPVLLGGLLVSSPAYRAIALVRKVKILLPYFFLTLVYLVVRLGGMPINPVYLPEFRWETTVLPAAFLLGPLLLPLLAWALVLRGEGGASWEKGRKAVHGLWPYLPFVLVSCAPYVGHPFFSPAWLLLPGFFWLFGVCATDIALPKTRWVVPSVLGALVVSLLTVYLNQLGWWHWKEAQQRFHQIVRELPLSRELVIQNCDAPERPDNTFERVIGGPKSLGHLARLHGQTHLKIRLIKCDSEGRHLARLLEGVTVLRWKFPEIEVLSMGRSL